MLHGLPTDRPQIGGSWPPRAVSGTGENNLIIITIWQQQKQLHDKASERLQLCTGLVHLHAVNKKDISYDNTLNILWERRDLYRVFVGKLKE